jgi:hypothetical protein
VAEAAHGESESPEVDFPGFEVLKWWESASHDEIIGELG